MLVKIIQKAAEFEFQVSQMSLSEDERQSLIATLQRLAGPSSPLNTSMIASLIRRLEDESEPQIANRVPAELASLIESAESHIQSIKPYLQNKGLLDNRERNKNNYPTISKDVQKKLNQLGAPHIDPDGSLGPATKAAIEWFKKKNNIRMNMSDDEVYSLIMRA